MNVQSLFRCCYPNESENDFIQYKEITINISPNKHRDYQRIFKENLFPVDEENINFNDPDIKINNLTKIRNSLSLTTPYSNMFSQCIPEISSEKDLITQRTTSNNFHQNFYKTVTKKKGFVSKEDSLIYNSQKELSKEEINSAPCLLIKEIEGNILNVNQVMINSLGAVDGARGQNDSISYFGIKLYEGKRTINDFSLNINDLSNAPENLFIIYYKRGTYKFYLRATKENNIETLPIVLIKLNSVLVLKSKHLIKIDLYYFQINTFPDKIDISVIGIKEKSKVEKKKFVYYLPRNIITIGRSKLCDIAFLGEKSFSRIHCSIYHENNNWILKDGYNTPSTNGVWVFPQHSFELQNETVFRVQNSLFNVKMNKK